MLNRLRRISAASSSINNNKHQHAYGDIWRRTHRREQTNPYKGIGLLVTGLASTLCVTGYLFTHHLNNENKNDQNAQIQMQRQTNGAISLSSAISAIHSHVLSHTSFILCDSRKDSLNLSRSISKEGTFLRQNSLDDLKSKQPIVSVHAVRGPRASMEDRTFNSRDNTFFAIFDGHGGWQVAECAKDNLYAMFLGELEKSSGDPEKAFVQSFESLSNKILGIREWDHVGSTAAVVYLQKDHIITANVGDSRAVLCRNAQAIDITNDHKPNAYHERKRIEKIGGTVSWYGYRGPDRQPVTGMGAYRVNGNLAVSRALGDSTERPFISSEPEIMKFERSKDDKFIIVASDGLWDVISSQEAVDFVQQILDGSYGRTNSTLVRGYSGDRGMLRAVIDQRKSRMAHYLIEESLRKGTTDNVSVLVIWLK